MAGDGYQPPTALTTPPIEPCQRCMHHVLHQSGDLHCNYTSDPFLEYTKSLQLLR